MMLRRRKTAAAVAVALAAIPVRTGFIPMTGGLDVVTPPLVRSPGTARAAQNFEADINGGYRLIDGYERYDGRPSPSDATYTTIAATLVGSTSTGSTLVGATSGATGTIIALPATGFVLTKVVGTFVSGENLQVSAVTKGVATAGPIVGGAPTPILNAQYLNLAADVYRADIAAVTGSGRILGGFYYNDTNYAFRNNAGGTAAALFKETASGWTAVALGRQLSFTSGGTDDIAEGDTITGATSGATAVVTRVVLTSGSWAAGTAAGKVIFASQTGTFQAENLNIGASLNVATIAGDSAAITLLPGGRYECIKENFGGAANTTRVYGCDGVNKAFEFDGTVYVPIDTGMTNDAPIHVVAHNKHLMLAFDGSHQFSADGNPYVWSVVVGAGELGMGDTITGYSVQPSSEGNAALAVFTRNRLSILYGSSVADFALKPYRDEVGAYPYTIQDVGYSLFLDDRGLTDIQTSQAYGNFAHNAISNRVRSLLNDYRRSAIASCICRDKSQYRIFFTNGYALYVTLVGKKLIGIMPALFPDIVRCAWTAEMSDGTEVMFFGSDDGYVYQMDKGTSFDGDEKEFYLDMAYNHLQSPGVDKQYRDARLEVSGSGYAGFNFGWSLGYGSTDISQPDAVSVITSFSAVYWDSFVWDAFFWDGTTLLPSVIGMDGTGENVSIAVRGTSDFYASFTLSGALVNYSPLRRLRP